MYTSRPSPFQSPTTGNYSRRWAAAMLVSSVGGGVNSYLTKVALELRFEGNLSPLRDNQLDFQSSHIVLNLIKVSLVQRVLMFLRDSLGT